MARPPHGGTRALDQQLAQVFVTSLADPEQLWPSTRRRLAWHQTEPRGEVTSAGKRRTIVDRGCQCRRIQHPDAGSSGQAPGRLICLGLSCEFVVVSPDSPVEFGPFPRMPFTSA